MENLKIKVNSKSESKEAQELFFELGYKWFSGGKNIQHLEQSCSSGFGYLVAWSTGCFTNVIQCGCGAEDAKEITLQELRDMVNQDQDEPFLTPESLNDQYAEIERVRQQTDSLPGFKHDFVNHPKHYCDHPSGIECIEITRHHDFAIGNAIKYLWRAGLKDSDNEIQDLKKAVWYIQDKIAQLENK